MLKLTVTADGWCFPDVELLMWRWWPYYHHHCVAAVSIQPDANLKNDPHIWFYIWILICSKFTCYLYYVCVRVWNSFCCALLCRMMITNDTLIYFLTGGECLGWSSAGDVSSASQPTEPLLRRWTDGDLWPLWKHWCAPRTQNHTCERRLQSHEGNKSYLWATVTY